MARVARAIVLRKTRVIDLDLAAYFDNVQHHVLLRMVAKRVSDAAVLRLLKRILQGTGRQGLPQGGPLSPLLSNIYLTPVDRMLEKAHETTRHGSYWYVTYARWADDRAARTPSEPTARGGDAAQEMGVGPPEPLCRERFQTTASCAG
jgi:RNA-directed DNA polymerase